MLKNRTPRGSESLPLSVTVNDLQPLSTAGGAVVLGVNIIDVAGVLC